MSFIASINLGPLRPMPILSSTGSIDERAGIAIGLSATGGVQPGVFVNGMKAGFGKKL
jgi:hypothetical protein